MARERIEAPKSLEPVETPVRVRGMMEVEIVESRADVRASGVEVGVSGVVDMLWCWGVCGLKVRYKTTYDSPVDPRCFI